MRKESWVLAWALFTTAGAAARAQEFAITVDAREMSPLGMVVSPQWSLTNLAPKTLSLAAGDHVVSYDGGSGAPPALTFSVTALGTVDYAAELDGLLSGRGGTTLTVHGVEVTLDLSQLSPPDVYFFGAADFVATGIDSYRLLPGLHRLQYDGSEGERPDQPQVEFTVTPAGAVSYEPELEGLLAGRGTATLTVLGVAMTLDLSLLSPINVHFYGAGDYVPTDAGDYRLLPGYHQLSYNGGSPQPALMPQAGFTVSANGTITPAPELEGILRLTGPRMLQVPGAAIRVDLSRLGPEEVFFYGAEDYVASAVHEFHLLPGDHRLHYDGGEGSEASTLPQVSFTVTAAGTVAYDAILEGIVTGAGSRALTVHGTEVRVACGDINTGPQPIVIEGTDSESCSRMRLLPGVHRISSACAAPTVVVTLRTDGTIDFAPEFDAVVEGRNTSTLAFRDADGAPSDCALNFALGQVDSFELSPAEQDRLFKLRLPPGESLLDRVVEVRLDGEAGDENALFVRWNRPPSPALHDLAAAGPGLANQRLVVGPGRDQRLYVLVRGGVFGAGSNLVTLRVQEVSSGLALAGFLPPGAAGGAADVRISGVATGAGFDGATAFGLEPADAGGAGIPAARAVVASGGRAELTFDVGSAGAGAYDLVAREGDVEARLPRAFELRSTTSGPVLAVEIEAFAQYPHCEDARLTLRYRNAGDRELAAPLLRITASEGTEVWLDGEPPCPRGEEGSADCRGNVALALAHGEGGVPGRLAPGASGALPVYFRRGVCLEPACTPADSCLSFRIERLDPLAARGRPIPWDDMPPPSGVAAQDWERSRVRLAARLGVTWAEYEDNLGRDAAAIARRGGPMASAREVFRYSARAADSQRASLGVFGRVRDDTGAPLRGVCVVALEAGVARVADRTNRLGELVLDGLRHGGRYELGVVGHTIVISGGPPAQGLFEDHAGVEIVARPSPGVLAGVCPDCEASCPRPDEGDLPEEPLLLADAPPGLLNGLFREAAVWSYTVVDVKDPPEKTGPEGAGDVELEKLQSEAEPLLYAIRFVNSNEGAAGDPPQGAVREIVVRDFLDVEKLDPTSVRFLDMTLAGAPSVRLDRGPASGLPVTSRSAFRDPVFGTPLDVGIQTSVDAQSGLVQWSLRALVPDIEAELGWIGDPQIGLISTGAEREADLRNEGTVTFSVRLRAGLAPEDIEAGTVDVVNEAAISFTGRPGESTNQARSTIRLKLAPLSPMPMAPRDGEREVPATQGLEWSARYAESFRLYLWEGAPGLEPAGPPAAAGAMTAGAAGYLPRLPWRHATTYSWRVEVENSSGLGGASGGPWTFTTAVEPPPCAAAPAGPESPASGAASLPLTPLLEWNAAPGAELHDVYLWPSGGTAARVATAVRGSRHVVAEPLAPGREYSWRVFARNANAGCSSAGEPGTAGPVWTFRTAGFERFRRGESSGDGRLNITDPVFTLGYLFLGGAPPGCLDAADADDSGRLDITDAVFTLAFLFLGGPPPPPPFTECGADPTANDPGDCARPGPCAEGLAQ